MQIYYSGSARGFFLGELKEQYEAAGNWPEDAQPISVELYRGLMDEQAGGRLIVPGPDGLPLAVDPPPPSLEELKEIVATEKASRLSEATAKISPLADAVELGMASESEVADLNAWRIYRIGVSRIDNLSYQPDYPNVVWPQRP